MNNSNLEQIEADLHDLVNQKNRVAVVIPIRGAILITFYGTLSIESDILFHLTHDNTGESQTAFRPADVFQIRRQFKEDGGDYIAVVLSTPL